MKRVIRLQTDDGQKIPITLDHWACGVDRKFRRWVREGDEWRCLESGEIAQRRSFFGRKLIRRGN